ncbi:hypothetical protein C2845_PM07G17640 [Panicum miliaceum]|uniref:Uncharacterized protein n=1 Tax=Panicum miliaceum TaxID=4540 RepID=A0A3L6SGG5_PANMI|nr:hypothetical protein C2845_PM07G17640 [Panicum miliaceum]
MIELRPRAMKARNAMEAEALISFVNWSPPNRDIQTSLRESAAEDADSRRNAELQFIDACLIHGEIEVAAPWGLNDAPPCDKRRKESPDQPVVVSAAMTESATRQNTAAETLNPSSALLSSARRTFSGTPPLRIHLLDPTPPPPPPTPVTAATAASDPVSLGGATLSAAGFASAAARSSPERSFAMVTADSFCGEPAGDASAEEAFGGVGGVESWVSARASVMLPNSLADSAAFCSDLASEDAGAGGGGGAGAGDGWGGERGGDVSPSRGRGGEASALGGSGGGGGSSGGCGGEDGEESPGGSGVGVGPAEGGGGGGGGAGAGFSGERDPSREGCCEGGEGGATGSTAGGGGRIGEAIEWGLLVAVASGSGGFVRPRRRAPVKNDAEKCPDEAG